MWHKIKKIKEQKFLAASIMTGLILLATSGISPAEEKPPIKLAPKAKKKTEEPKDEKHKVTVEDTRYEVTNSYVNKWIKMPSFQAMRVESRELINYEPKEGQATVIFFLASWCIPCQQMIEDFTDLERDFNKKNTRFVYIFVHDDPKDATAFINTYQLNKADLSALHVLGNDKVKEAYHFPVLPSFYVADRHTWMSMRSRNITKAKLQQLHDFLDLHTAF